MKIHIALVVALVLPRLSMAQSVEEAAIMKSVNQLFEGMKSGDSAMVHSAFSNEVNFVSISKDKTGQPVLKRIKLKEFLFAVGSAHSETWSEVIWSPVVQVDGNFAQVWANYGFYLGKKFSHCGVDAFQLFKGPDGKWRIFDLADTRRQVDCVVPSSVSDQFK